jgi:MFS family permease
VSCTGIAWQDVSPAAPRAFVPALIFIGTCVAVISSLGAPLVPAIAADTGASPAQAQWTLTITLLVGAVATPVVGRLGDGPHRRPVVLTILGLVVAGGVLAALPLGLGWIIAGRGLQGFGLALTPVAIATARDVLVGERARLVAAALSLTTAVGLGLGYPLTGAIAELGGVHAAFWFGAAFTAVALATAVVVFPPSPARPAARLDVVGAVLLGGGLACALLVLSEGEAQGWTSPWLLVLAVVALVALVAWVFWELRRRAPLVDLRLARGRTAGVAHAASLLIGLSNYLMITGVTFLAQTPVSSGYGFGASVVLSGLILLPFSVGSLLAGRVSASLVVRGRGAVVLPASALVVAAAAVLFATTRTQLWELFVIMGVCGFGVGGAFSAFPGLIARAVPPSETGSAMALNQVLRYVGFATGSALTATLLEAATPDGGGLPASGGYTVIGLVGCAVALVTAGLTAALLRRPSSAAPAVAEAAVTGQ